MPNAVKGEVSLTVDGREFTLVLDHEALIEAESAYGKPLTHLMADATLGFAGACRALLFGALRARHPEVTRRDAGTMFLENTDAASEALAAAAEAAFPKGAEGKDSKNPPRAGKNSGNSGAESGSSPKRSGAPRRKRTK